MRSVSLLQSKKWLSFPLLAWPDVAFACAAAAVEEAPLPAYQTPLRPQQEGQKLSRVFRRTAVRQNYRK